MKHCVKILAMEIRNHEVHVFLVDLTSTNEPTATDLALLSKDELIRANRFHFPLHRQRFITARRSLRQILSHYLAIPPADILFAYTEHQKPYINYPQNSCLQFNLAHSENMAVYAITQHQAIGIDIEKVQVSYKQGIAERFFSPEENLALQQLPDHDRIRGFYQIWAGKEAIIKAIGKGLSYPLNQFSVPTSEPCVIHAEQQSWYLLPLALHPHYTAALATSQAPQSVTFLTLSPSGQPIIQMG